MCAPARALERSNIHFGSGDFESAGARGRAAYSVKCHPPPAERPMDRFGSLAEVRVAVEREYILKKLGETNGNVTRTAELLGLERSNLYRKMKTLGIGICQEL